MRDLLFRSEVADRRRMSNFGAVRIVPPLSHRYAMITSVTLAVAVVAWLFIGTYTRRVHVTGVLVPVEGLLDVSTRASGTVTSLLATEGQEVSVGEPLATVSGERSSERLGDTSEQVALTLQADRRRLEHDMAQAAQLSDDQADALRQQISTGNDQLRHIDGQIRYQNAQIELQEEMLKKVSPLLAKGYISAFQVQQQRSQLLTTKGDLAGLMRQRADIRQQVESAESQIRQLPMQLSAKLGELSGQLATNKQTLAQVEADRAVMLRAPSNGVVASVMVKKGQALPAGQVVLTIIPHGSSLIARLLIKSEAVGFVKDGSPVAMHLQAFPYQKFGVQKGTVIQVSRSAMTPQEAMVLLGQEQVEQEPLYRVDVRLENQFVTAYGQHKTLKPGMTLDADILLERRRLIEWMLEPLMGMTKRYDSGEL